MREGFREIVSGWTLVSGMADLTERIELAAKWVEINGPLETDEEATIKLMIEAQIARGIGKGDFEPFISGGDFEFVSKCPNCEQRMDGNVQLPSCNECECCFCSEECRTAFHEKEPHDYNKPLQDLS